jgi:DNA polymerase-4
MVAKIACTLGKPNGLLLVPPRAVRWLLDPLPVRRLWGVGPVLESKLGELGIETIAQLARAEPNALSRAAGSRASELIALARGQDPRDVVLDRAPKSYGEENTFERDVSEREVVTAALTAHAETVARRLRKDGYAGRTVTLKIKLGRRRGFPDARLVGEGSEPVYPLLTRQRTLAEPTDDGALIREAAVALWDAAGVVEPVRLLGVSLSGLSRRKEQQLELFAPRQPRDKLGPALDAIQTRFGTDAIGRAVPKPEKLTPSMQRKRGESA